MGRSTSAYGHESFCRSTEGVSDLLPADPASNAGTALRTAPNHGFCRLAATGAFDPLPDRGERRHCRPHTREGGEKRLPPPGRHGRPAAAGAERGELRLHQRQDARLRPRHPYRHAPGGGPAAQGAGGEPAGHGPSGLPEQRGGHRRHAGVAGPRPSGQGPCGRGPGTPRPPRSRHGRGHLQLPARPGQRLGGRVPH